MEIRVKLFATLCQYSPGSKAGVPFAVDLPEGATLADLVEKLDLPRNLVKVVFVNGLVRESDYRLQPADEVGMFPPIAGGARPLPREVNNLVVDLEPVALPGGEVAA